MAASPHLVLASKSAGRRAMLEPAGVPFVADVANVDEATVKDALMAERASAEQAAETLAELKAIRVASRHPQALVLGCDSILDLDGEWFDKPADLAGARDHLMALRGKRHRLVSAAVLVRDGVRIWAHANAARLTMRNFSDAFLDDYLADIGDLATASVGAYQIEGPGVQLFSNIDGDPFTIIGMPLLPVLDMLREHGVVVS
jgi:septum formation protein